MNPIFIAYQGEKFTIEWYIDQSGKSSAQSYYNKLPESQKKKFTHLLYTICLCGKVFNQEKFRYEGDHIYALKIAPDRFLCFFYDGKKIIITNAYEKKCDKMPNQEKQKALNAMVDYIKRCKGGFYYGKKD